MRGSNLQPHRTRSRKLKELPIDVCKLRLLPLFGEGPLEGFLVKDDKGFALADHPP